MFSLKKFVSCHKCFLYKYYVEKWHFVYSELYFLNKKMRSTTARVVDRKLYKVILTVFAAIVNIFGNVERFIVDGNGGVILPFNVQSVLIRCPIDILTFTRGHGG